MLTDEGRGLWVLVSPGTVSAVVEREPDVVGRWERWRGRSRDIEGE